MFNSCNRKNITLFAVSVALWRPQRDHNPCMRIASCRGRIPFFGGGPAFPRAVGATDSRDKRQTTEGSLLQCQTWKKSKNLHNSATVNKHGIVCVFQTKKGDFHQQTLEPWNALRQECEDLFEVLLQLSDALCIWFRVQVNMPFDGERLWFVGVNLLFLGGPFPNKPQSFFLELGFFHQESMGYSRKEMDLTSNTLDSCILKLMLSSDGTTETWQLGRLEIHVSHTTPISAFTRSRNQGRKLQVLLRLPPIF